MIRALALVAGTLVPSAAHAIPTPDAIIGGGAALGWFVGAIAAALGLGVTRIRGLRRGKRTSGLIAVVVAALLIAALHQLARPATGPARDAESEYRCDFGYHLARNDADGAFDQLRQHPGYQRRDIGEAADIESGASTLVVDTRLPWWFASGHLAWPAQGVEAEHVWPPELAARLRSWLASTPEDGARRLVWATYRPNPLLELTPEQRQEVLGLLSEVERVDHFVLHAGSSEPRQSSAALILGLAEAREVGESVRLAQASRVVDWPIVEEGFLFDAQAVWFEGAQGRMDGVRLGRALLDDRVHVVVPFASYYRPADTWVPEFVGSYLRSVSPPRVHLLDHSRNDIRQAIDDAIAAIGNNPYVIAGGSKFDTMHYGLSFAWQVAQRNPDAAFRGHSADLALAAAWIGEHEARWTRGVPQSWVDWSAATLVRAAGRPERVPLVVGLAGVLVGLFLSPVMLVTLFGRARDLQVAAAIHDAQPIDRRAMAAVADAARSGIRPHPALVGVAALATIAATAGAGALAAATTTRIGVAATVDASAVVIAALAFALPELLLRRGSGTAWGPAVRWSALPAVTIAAVLPAYPPAIAQLLAGVAVVRAALTIAPSLALRRRRAPAALDAGPKATRLVALAAERVIGVRVPETTLVPADAALRGELPLLRRAGPWAVRSSAQHEDGAEFSFAGAYLTELNVPTDDLAVSCSRVARSYPDGRGSVIIQRMIPSRLDAVCFTSDPSSTSLLTIVTTTQVGGALVAGLARSHATWRLSRLTGHWYPTPTEALRGVLDRIAWAALSIAQRAGCAQDVELVVPRGSNTPVTLQARPATTRTTESHTIDTAALATLLAAGPDVVLRRSPVADAIGPIDWDAMQIVARLHAAGGARGAGARLLGLATPRSGDLVLLAGQMYETEQPTTLSERARRARAIRRMERSPEASVRFIEGLLQQSMKGLDSIRDAAPDREQMLQHAEALVLPGVYAAIAWSELMAASSPRGRVPEPAAWLRALGTVQMLRDRATLDRDAWTDRWGHRSNFDWNPSAQRVRDGADVRPIAQVRSAPAPDDDEMGADWLAVASVVREAAHDIGTRAIALLAGSARHVAADAAGGAASCPALHGVLRPTEVDAYWLSRSTTRWVSAPAELSGVAWIPGSPDEEPPMENAVLFTDALEPRWIPAAGHAGVTAWVAARGSVLSHAAIVAREYGLPVLVSAAVNPQPGQRVHMSQSGEVRLGGSSTPAGHAHGDEGGISPLASTGSGSDGSFSSPTRA